MEISLSISWILLYILYSCASFSRIALLRKTILSLLYLNFICQVTYRQTHYRISPRFFIIDFQLSPLSPNTVRSQSTCMLSSSLVPSTSILTSTSCYFTCTLSVSVPYHNSISRWSQGWQTLSYFVKPHVSSHSFFLKPVQLDISSR